MTVSKTYIFVNVFGTICLHKFCAKEIISSFFGVFYFSVSVVHSAQVGLEGGATGVFEKKITLGDVEVRLICSAPGNAL